MGVGTGVGRVAGASTTANVCERSRHEGGDQRLHWVRRGALVEARLPNWAGETGGRSTAGARKGRTRGGGRRGELARTLLRFEGDTSCS